MEKGFDTGASETDPNLTHIRTPVFTEMTEGL